MTEKNNEKNLIIFEDFNKEIKKTKEMFQILKKFEALNALIILDKKSKENIYMSLKNIPNIKTSDISNFSIFDLLKYKKVILTDSSTKLLEKRFV